MPSAIRRLFAALVLVTALSAPSLAWAQIPGLFPTATPASSEVPGDPYSQAPATSREGGGRRDPKRGVRFSLDFYDLSCDAKTLTVVVADVSGHGLPTGIVMAAAKASLSALARTGASGTRLMELLDVEVVRSTDPRTFVTLAYLACDLAAGSVAFTNAGHPYPYRVRPDGTVRTLLVLRIEERVSASA